MKEIAVGTPVWFLLLNPTAGIAGGGDGHPFHANVTHFNKDTGRVNLVVYDAHGQSFARQDVPFVESGADHPGGDYACPPDHGAATKAAKALGANSKRGGQKSADQLHAESHRPTTADGAPPLPAKTGDASTDVSNTALAHMSDSARAEGRNEGLPTTGGTTPTINADSLGDLSERDREALKEKDPAGWDKAVAKAQDDQHQRATKAAADGAAIAKTSAEQVKAAARRAVANPATKPNVALKRAGTPATAKTGQKLREQGRPGSAPKAAAKKAPPPAAKKAAGKSARK